MTPQQYLSETDKLFEEKVPTRVLNEDNPQYVLGWNMAKQLSKDFLHERQIGLVEVVKKEIEQLKWHEGNQNLGIVGMTDMRSGFNQGIDEAIKILKNLEK